MLCYVKTVREKIDIENNSGGSDDFMVLAIRGQLKDV